MLQYNPEEHPASLLGLVANGLFVSTKSAQTGSIGQFGVGLKALLLYAGQYMACFPPKLHITTTSYESDYIEELALTVIKDSRENDPGENNEEQIWDEKGKKGKKKQNSDQNNILILPTLHTLTPKSQIGTSLGYLETDGNHNLDDKKTILDEDILFDQNKTNHNHHPDPELFVEQDKYLTGTKITFTCLVSDIALFVFENRLKQFLNFDLILLNLPFQIYMYYSFKLFNFNFQKFPNFLPSSQIGNYYHLSVDSIINHLFPSTLRELFRSIPANSQKDHGGTPDMIGVSPNHSALKTTHEQNPAHVGSTSVTTSQHPTIDQPSTSTSANPASFQYTTLTLSMTHIETINLQQRLISNMSTRSLDFYSQHFFLALYKKDFFLQCRNCSQNIPSDFSFLNYVNILKKYYFHFVSFIVSKLPSLLRKFYHYNILNENSSGLDWDDCCQQYKQIIPALYYLDELSTAAYQTSTPLSHLTTSTSIISCNNQAIRCECSHLPNVDDDNFKHFSHQQIVANHITIDPSNHLYVLVPDTDLILISHHYVPPNQDAFLLLSSKLMSKSNLCTQNNSHDNIPSNFEIELDEMKHQMNNICIENNNITHDYTNDQNSTRFNTHTIPDYIDTNLTHVPSELDTIKPSTEILSDFNQKYSHTKQTLSFCQDHNSFILSYFV
jgi:hypothetical protein